MSHQHCISFFSFILNLFYRSYIDYVFLFFHYFFLEADQPYQVSQ